LCSNESAVKNGILPKLSEKVSSFPNANKRQRTNDNSPGNTISNQRSRTISEAQSQNWINPRKSKIKSNFKTPSLPNPALNDFNCSNLLNENYLQNLIKSSSNLPNPFLTNKYNCLKTEDKSIESSSFVDNLDACASNLLTSK